jgi:hypothetical protein
MKALLITLPATVEWSDYEKELKVVEDESQVMNFRVPFMPKDTDGITKVYLVYRGNIIGWQKYVGSCMKAFNCTTTNRDWSGFFIQRTGPFHRIDPIPYKGFRAFKYIDDETFKDY